MDEKDELPQLKELYERLREDAEGVVKELRTAQLVYRAVSMVMIVYGAVSLGMGIAGIVLTLVAHLTLFDMSLPGMLISIVIGIVLLTLGGKLDDKSEQLKKKYGGFDWDELKI